MFNSHNTDKARTLDAISKSQAIIQFKLDGTIIDANENFLNAMGYSLEEIKGRHHSMFVDPAYKASVEYKAFWEALARGEFQAAEYMRIAKGGREIWIQASYNPVFDGSGRPVRVVKCATDITARKLLSADHKGQIDAINKSQAVIEFDVNGVIRHANENFLDAMGYRAAEVEGKHHGIFVDEAYRNSAEYREFWQALGRGEFRAGEFRRFGKGGREIWIQASYNPILDPAGKVLKVVKYASDITEAKLESINASRLKLALDTSTANVMMADAEFNIIYMNESVTGFLKEAEEDIRKDLPKFDTAKLVGQNIDVFHKNPEHQRGMLAKLDGRYKTSILVGGRSFDLVANPVFGANKERLGTVVEWLDGTAKGQVDAINKSQAVIEFQPSGTIINANENFLAAMGYGLDEIKGRHHSMFADEKYKASPEYRQF